jgi:hypothetical protein
MSTRVAATSPADLDWLRSVLWPEASFRVSDARRPAAGTERVSTFGVLPSAERPRLLVPVHPAAAARAGLWQFNIGMATRARLAKAATGVALGSRLGWRLVRSRVHVDVAADAPAEAWASLPERRLAEALGREDLAVAVTFGSRRPNRKPVVQAIDPDGSAVAYAKVGWNELTDDLIRNEGAALRDLRDAPPRTFGAPALLVEGAWGAHAFLATAPIRHTVRRRCPVSAPPPGVALREVAERGAGVATTFRGTPMWRDLRTEIAAGADGIGERAAAVAERWERRFGDTPTTAGRWHGDWAPWNMARSGGRLMIWDWERSRDGAPLGLDAAHFAVQVTLGGAQRHHAAALPRAEQLGLAQLRSAGIEPSRWPALVTFYLFELLARYRRAAADGLIRADDEALQHVVGALEASIDGRRA